MDLTLGTHVVRTGSYTPTLRHGTPTGASPQLDDPSQHLVLVASPLTIVKEGMRTIVGTSIAAVGIRRPALEHLACIARGGQRQVRDRWCAFEPASDRTRYHRFDHRSSIAKVQANESVESGVTGTPRSIARRRRRSHRCRSTRSSAADRDGAAGASSNPDWIPRRIGRRQVGVGAPLTSVLFTPPTILESPECRATADDREVPRLRGRSARALEKD